MKALKKLSKTIVVSCACGVCELDFFLSKNMVNRAAQLHCTGHDIILIDIINSVYDIKDAHKLKSLTAEYWNSYNDYVVTITGTLREILILIHS
jgi:hypothetical protein